MHDNELLTKLAELHEQINNVLDTNEQQRLRLHDLKTKIERMRSHLITSINQMLVETNEREQK